MTDIQTVRKIIEESAARFFRRRVIIDERMYQVLELTEEQDKGRPPTSLSLLASALRFQPSVASVLDDAGISISDADAPRLPSIRMRRLRR